MCAHVSLAPAENQDMFLFVSDYQHEKEWENNARFIVQSLLRHNNVNGR